MAAFLQGILPQKSLITSMEYYLRRGCCIIIHINSVIMDMFYYIVQIHVQ